MAGGRNDLCIMFKQKCTKENVEANKCWSLTLSIISVSVWQTGIFAAAARLA